MGHTLIIAEAGVNHNGDLESAKQLVLAAKEAGADIVKFQTANVDSLVSGHAEMAEYQKKNTGKIESQRDMLQKILLSYNDFIELADFCEKTRIQFLSTPFDIESIGFLSGLGVNIWKIPSGEITNYPYLVEIARTGRPIILSTGMSTLDEIGEAINLLQKNGAGKITLLHCTTEYPTPYEHVNLNAMATLRDKFGLDIGYSDHTLGIEVPIAAVAMGAVIIEKHFTLSREMEGPDHKASLEPGELKEMVQAIQRLEMAFGDGIKRPTDIEEKNAMVARKSIIARKDIQRGECLTEENLTTKRPGTGISPMKWNEILGTIAIRDFKKDELIEI
ncbi:MAG: N-acetylneuraminate synthase [Lachnospiraceae bacterium]|jgi:N,N'-diacetyllegionaminate synthase|nr:N-acetylneuraminate synthase [Lachnospiraceae bacterium]